MSQIVPPEESQTCTQKSGEGFTDPSSSELSANIRDTMYITNDTATRQAVVATQEERSRLNDIYEEDEYQDLSEVHQVSLAQDNKESKVGLQLNGSKIDTES